MELPKGWAVAPLQSICDIIYTGDSINRSEKEEKYKGQITGYPYIATKDVAFDSVVDYENGVNIPFDIASQFKIAPPDSTLICIEGGSSGRKIGMLKQKVCFGNKLCCLHTAIIYSRFLFYYCQAPIFQMLFIDKQKAERKSVTTAQLKELSIVLPPLAEQQRIVAKIDALFSKLDKGVETLQSIRQQLRTYRQAVLKWAFEGKCSKKWTKIQLKDLFAVSPQNGLYMPSSSYGTGTSIIRIDNFYDGRIIPDRDFKRVMINTDIIETYCLDINDLLINRVNSMPYLGKCGLVLNLSEPTVFESNIMRIKLDEKKCYSKFITYFLCSMMGKKELKKNAKQAVNQASINQTDVSNVELHLPDLSTQRIIVAAIESRLSVCDKLEAIVDENLAKAEALRQSILKKAFAGQLVPQDPNDEAAERLLERIKSGQKHTAVKTKSRGSKRNG